MQTRTTSRSQSREIDRCWPALGLAVAVILAWVAGVIGVAVVPEVVHAVVLTLLSGALVVAWRIRRQAPGVAAEKTSLAEGLCAAAIALVAARWMGGLGIEAYALVYLVVAWVVSTASWRTAVGVVGAVALAEGAAHLMGTASAALALGPAWGSGLAGVDWSILGIRWGLMGAFALVAWSLVGRGAEERRKVYENELERERSRLMEEAREFRLIHAGRSDSPVNREEAEELIVRDAVDAVHHTVFVTLDLVKTALRAHTVVLLWFDLRNEALRIKELVSDSDDIVEGGIDPAGGVIGGITRQRETVSLSRLRPDFKGLGYYLKPSGVTEFVGVPVIEKGHLRGVICADRCRGDAFDEQEIRVIEEASEYVLRVLENERLISSIERTRFEVGRFYEASRKLNEVLTLDEAYQVALESIRAIADYDFAAVTLYDDDTEEHRVVCVEGHAAASKIPWEEITFAPNQGLISMVVKNRHYLPVGGQLRDRRSTVITDGQDFSAVSSLLVLPLIVQDQPVGTMVIAHEKPGQFPTERREMLEVVTNQVAVTIQNARLYSRMEDMAKYDALTKLANRRTFEQRLGEAMARHKRAGRTFALVLTDIDHFKSVNDTYGHPVGDEVLRHVGRTFTEQLREIDLPARYGGEEFVMILEDTDMEGARQVADRLRIAIGDLKFDTDKGPLQCTISMGIALGPWDSDEPHTLVDLADQALYHSKENGRNQVSIYRELLSGAA